MFVSLDSIDIQCLFSDACQNKLRISRKLLHTPDSPLMQCMLIAFAPNTTYPPFSDNLPGQIVFTCLRGSMGLDIYDGILKNVCRSFRMLPGDVVSIPRSAYRSTMAYESGAVFLESIEGPHQATRRIHIGSP
jgi:hypothetical protein